MADWRWFLPPPIEPCGELLRVARLLEDIEEFGQLFRVEDDVGARLLVDVTVVSALTFAGTGGALALRVFKLDRGDQAFMQSSRAAA